jgi:hypothetical protein
MHADPGSYTVVRGRLTPGRLTPGRLTPERVACDSNLGLSLHKARGTDGLEAF